MNPPLIDGILNVLPYELVSYKGYEKLKKWSMYSSMNTVVEFHGEAGEIQ